MAQLDIDVDDLPGDAIGQLAELRAHTGLRLPDCCVLLTAERHGPARSRPSTHGSPGPRPSEALLSGRAPDRLPTWGAAQP